MRPNDPTLLARNRRGDWAALFNVLNACQYDDGDVRVRTERKRLTERIRFRNAMEYSAIGMALVGTEGQYRSINL